MSIHSFYAHSSYFYNPVMLALPPVSCVYLDQEEIRTYGNTRVLMSDDAYFEEGCWKLPHPGESFLEVDFYTDSSYPHKLTLMCRLAPAPGDRAVDPCVTVNGKRVELSKEFWDGTPYSRCEIDITPFLNKGQNTIRIENEMDSRGFFWIHHLGVSVQFNPFFEPRG